LSCKLSKCGDNFINAAAGEECDANNGNNSATCNGKNAGLVSCKVSACGDNFPNSAAGEDCDSTNGAESATCIGLNAPVGLRCKTSTCGDNFVNVTATEQCDATSGSDSPTCTGKNAPVGKQCRTSTCGDNYINATAGETCDSSNGNDTSTCNGSMAGAVKCKARACGDNYINPAIEDCEDGNNQTEACAYGLASCKVCNSSCVTVDGATAACNDGVVQASFGEVCDDGNSTCGSCASDCKSNTSAAASGTIIVVKSSDMVDGDYFTLDDGFNAPVTFEYRSTGSPTPAAGNIAIVLGNDGSTTVRNKTVTAINAGAVTIAASPGGAVQAASPSKTVTFTTSAAHKLAVGNDVVISGVGVAGYNGTWSVTGIPTATTFTVDVATTGLAASGAGTATLALDITAAQVGSNSPQLSVTNDRKTVLGNKAIATPLTTSLAVSGMGSGTGNTVGQGGDCLSTKVCKANPDCESFSCSVSSGTSVTGLVCQ
jgi:hypothetical protein